MSLSWNEIKTRAAAFVNEWREKAPTAREEADAQTFQTEFFHIFGVERSQVAIFEQKVKLLGDASGYIDLFWKGHIMIEMKSPGKDMKKAYEQAKGYANGLDPALLPRAILICDFNRFHHYNLDANGTLTEFALTDLVQYVELFSDLAGYRDVEYKKQDQVNIEAAEKMGRLHDRLKEIGYEGHQLEVYLVRILFCLFADDTGIFEHDDFLKYILQRTGTDGSDLGQHLQMIFEVLNKPADKRLKTLDEQLGRFPYINGHLFEEHLDTAAFDSAMREALIDCCRLDWSKISPAIFGSMFQSVMNPKERRNLGAHYTSEENILKLIHPLFLDGLWEEFDKLRKLKSEIRKVRLNEFHDRLARLKFLDPACGCGNFLVISYRELRILEMAVIKEILGGERILDVDTYIKVNVDQFYGIEIEEFPSQIAQVAMWLMDHQMNLLVRDMFGEYYVRIPLRASASIVCANSLRIDWETVVPKGELSYILGNPPFVGASNMTAEQKNEAVAIFGNIKLSNSIDYVGAWYHKAGAYIQGTDIAVAFVSTNSITQGEQVAPLWDKMLNQYNVTINFAHRTFKWSNEARGNAAVHCVIVGFSIIEASIKQLFIGNLVIRVKNINPYLVDASNITVLSRAKPICNVPEISKGNQPSDGGNLILTEEEKNNLILMEPQAEQFIRTYIGSKEFINNEKRYCLWLVNANPSILRNCPEVLKRIEKVKYFRLASSALNTQKKADIPQLFFYISQPDTDYLMIPEVSSERRNYIPIGFLNKDIIPSNKGFIVPNANLYHFGIVTSVMHMSWMRHVCGRLEMRYQYSGGVVYNNFPWPEPTDKQKAEIEEAAQGVLDARAQFPDSSLADLYDPDTMPPVLTKAHGKLDRLVEKAYGKSFSSDAERVAFLFERYRELVGG
jgi:hypothetical protein